MTDGSVIACMKTTPSISLRFLVLLLIAVAVLPVYPILARRIKAEREQLMRSEQSRLHMHVARICANEPIHLDKVFQIVNGFWSSVRTQRLEMQWDSWDGRVGDARENQQPDEAGQFNQLDQLGQPGQAIQPHQPDETDSSTPRHDFASFVVIDSTGRAVLASHDSRAIEGQIRPDLVALSDLSRARGGPMTSIGSCPVHGVPAIVVARPAKDDEGYDLPETVLVFLHREWFVTTLNASTLPVDSHILIWDSSLEPMIWSDSASGLEGTNYTEDVARYIAGAFSSGADYSSGTDVVTVWCDKSCGDHFLSIGAIRDSAGNVIAYVSITSPVAPVLSAARARAVTTVLGMGLLVGAAFAAFWTAVVYLLIKPITALAHTASRFGAGDMHARYTGSPFVKELARLSQAFNAMAGSLQMHAVELAVSRIRDKHPGVYNGLYLDNLMNELDGEAAGPCAVICANVDGLRIVNRIHGYEMGNAVLAEAARILVEAVGDKGCVIRTGGDSFVCVLPGHGGDALADVLGPIRERLSAVDLGFATISLSVGMATREDGSTSLLSLVNAAESSMHKNKFLHMGSPRGNLLHFLRRALAEKTHETEAHSERLQEMILKLSSRMGMAAGEVDDLLLLCMLHDVGKVGIPDSILNKPGPLTEDEWTVMRTHTEIGARIVGDNADLADVAESILSHHERWDGSGYPRNLAGDDIPLHARMLSVVDSFDAMISERTYKKAMGVDAALQEIKRCAGTQFDPVIADVFHEMISANIRDGETPWGGSPNTHYHTDQSS